MSPVNPEVKPTRAARISQTAARHSELVILVLGLVIGVSLTLIAGAVR